MNTLLKVLKNDKTPVLRNLIVLPLMLNPEPDEGWLLNKLLMYSTLCAIENVSFKIPELRQATEGRIPAMTHDVTPDLLRTKPDPEVEQRQNVFEQRALQVKCFHILLVSIPWLNFVICFKGAAGNGPEADQRVEQSGGSRH